MLNNIYDINEVSAWSNIFSLFLCDMNKGVNYTFSVENRFFIYQFVSFTCYLITNLL